VYAPSSKCAWAVVLLGLVGAVYSYLFGMLLLLVASSWQIVLYCVSKRLVGPGRSWRPLAWGSVAILGATALAVPLLRNAWQVSALESDPGVIFGGFGVALGRLLEAYTLHLGPWSSLTMKAAQIGAGVMLVAGMVLPIRQASTAEGSASVGRPLLTLYLWVPLLVGGVMLAQDDTIFAEPRYYAFLVPALCLLWGRGIDALLARSSVLGVSALALLVALAIAGISHLWLPQNLREDWRAAAHSVEAYAGPNDAVVVHVDYVHIAFERYFDGPQPVFFPFTDRLSGMHSVEPPLLGLLPFDTVWLVQSHTEQFDPDHLVERWLADRFPLATELYPSGVAVKGFITHYRLPELPPHVPRIDGRFDTEIKLVGCAVHDTRVAATDERSHPPSGWVHVALYWQAEGRPPGDYLATARMVDGAGQVWGEGLYRERDTLQVWPTSRWAAGDIEHQEVDINLNPITPPGDYRIVIGLVDPEGQPLGSEVICGDVKVVR